METDSDKVTDAAADEAAGTDTDKVAAADEAAGTDTDTDAAADEAAGADTDTAADEATGTDTDAASGDRIGRFDVDMAVEMFSFRGKSASGEGVDISIVRDHYHPDVRFRDAIQQIQGRDAVIEMMLRFPQRCKELRNTVHRAMQQDNVIFIEWTTEMVINPRIPTLADDGCTRLLLDDDAMVIDHRDYFDLWGDMIDSFPRASKVYRKIVQHME